MFVCAGMRARVGRTVFCSGFGTVAKINIIYRPVSGLAADAELLEKALVALGCDVSLRPAGEAAFKYKVQRLLLRHPNRAWPIKCDVNLFLEEIYPEWLPHARKNVLIPNQEWCRPETFRLLNRIDRVLCKTRYAQGIFSDLGSEVDYIGFTSFDRYDPTVKKNYAECLHLAGRSLQKGTGTLAKVWMAHPQWPVLTIVSRHPEIKMGIDASNIQLLGLQDHEAIVQMQNRCGIHICPSEAEGFGHNIVEGMGCAAVMICTDAPPMNELVTKDRGILVAYAGRKPQSLGWNHYVDERSLENSIEAALGMTIEDKEALGLKARDWFLANADEFRLNLCRALESLLATNMGAGPGGT